MRFSKQALTTVYESQTVVATHFFYFRDNPSACLISIVSKDINMIPAPHYDNIDQLLNQEDLFMNEGFLKGFPKNSQTVGFIIFDQNFERGPVIDFIKNIDMINQHSGSDFYFFMCGISRFGKNENGARHIGEMDGVPLYHNPQYLQSFINAFQDNIPGWSYNFGLDIILIDIINDGNFKRLDYSSVIFFHIDELINSGIIDRPPQLIGKIIKLSREGRCGNAAAFRNELKLTFGVNWFKGLILALFPAHIGKLARAQAALGGGTPLPE